MIEDATRRAHRRPEYTPRAVLKQPILVCLLAVLVSGLAQAGLGPETLLGEQAVSQLREQTVLLAGATGNNGSAILRQLQSLEIPVRAMSRDAEGASEEFGSDGITWVEADVTEPASLAAAVDGVDVV